MQHSVVWSVLACGIVETSGCYGLIFVENSLLVIARTFSGTPNIQIVQALITAPGTFRWSFTWKGLA